MTTSRHKIRRRKLLKQMKTKLLYASVITSLTLSSAAWAAATADTVTVPGNVSTWVTTAAHAGTAPDNQTVAIAVHMVLRNVAGLRQLATEVSKPGSPEYGHYLTPDAVRERFAPARADVAAVEAMLKRGGMTDVHVGPANAYISATATVAQLRAAFAVSQETYVYGKKTLRANREAPSIPTALAGKILYIEGLDDSTTLKQPHHISATQGDVVAPASFTPGLVAHAQTANATAAITPPPVASNTPSPYCSTYFGDTQAVLSTAPAPYKATVPWLPCGYTPQQVQAAYGLNLVKPDGTGVTVGILDAYASPTIEADANQYAGNHSLPPLTSANFSQLVPFGIYNVSPLEACGPYSWWAEESLDVSAVHGSAPGANIVYIGARDCGTSLTIALLNAIYNYQADILTNSYGYGGEAITAADLAMQDQAFMVAVAQGQTVLFSTGDDGDLSQDNGVATGSYESTSPYVTGVGGTSLALMNAKGAKSEWGWGTARDLLANATVNSAASVTTTGLTYITDFGLTYANFSFYAGSGGGLSLVEAQPSYQVGVVPASLATSLNEASGSVVTLPKPQRVTPDVAMVADPYTGYLYGETYTIAGDGHSDMGCTALTSTTEYCEYTIGGTSLASPLMAGMMAVVDQARLGSGKALVGFANPWLYGAKIGTTMNSAGINDILAPASPTAVLRGYVTDDTEIRLVTMNSVPLAIYPTPFANLVCPLTICEGINDVFNFVTPGYDDVTGLGVPYAPSLITQ
jgi:subtilase family serine protease